MEQSEIKKAAELIRAGRLVAFPTETVYGLGANALDAEAVGRIFEAKGRPSTVPLIVHVASVEMAQSLATVWPEAAATLTRKFWPGPLTLVLPKRTQIPEAVTAGLATVGLRMPSHPLALELIRAAGVPIAAPSANRFSELSPTMAEHVRESLGRAVDLILDGGSTDVGIESTVLSLSGEPPVLLRPGMVSQRAIEEIIGPIQVAGNPGKGSHPAPGMTTRHYSPRTPMFLVPPGCVPDQGRGAYVGFLEELVHPVVRAIWMPMNAAMYASLLYETLHRLDREGLDWIAVATPPDVPEWAGIRDRLQRAAAK